MSSVNAVDGPPVMVRCAIPPPKILNPSRRSRHPAQAMESTSGGVKGYWKSRNSLRGRRRRKTPVIQLTDPSRKNPNPRRRFWRIRLKPKLRVLKKSVCYPGWLLGKLRDAYVGMMMKFAGAYGGGGGGFYGAGMGISLAPRPTLKEYDDKVIVEMYKNMINQGLL